MLVKPLARFMREIPVLLRDLVSQRRCFMADFPVPGAIVCWLPVPVVVVGAYALPAAARHQVIKSNSITTREDFS